MDAAIRYNSEAMRRTWNEVERSILERQIWVLTLKTQQAFFDDEAAAPHAFKDVGGAIARYEAVVRDINLRSIAHREHMTNHETKAKIEEFNALALSSYIHLGLTSHDVTELRDQVSMLEATGLILGETKRVLSRLGGLANVTRNVKIIARTHGQPAQITTVGACLSVFGSEIYNCYMELLAAATRYPIRGIAGAIGNSQDLAGMIRHLYPDEGAEEAYESATIMSRLMVRELFSIRPGLGYLPEPNLTSAAFQTVPRTADARLALAIGNLADSMRALAEWFRTRAAVRTYAETRAFNYIGSSAMPHKHNPTIAERVIALTRVAKEAAISVYHQTEDMRYEGDVATSAGRRFTLPTLYQAAEGAARSLRTALRKAQFRSDPDVNRAGPWESSLRVVVESLRVGGREEAYAKVKSDIDNPTLGRVVVTPEEEWAHRVALEHVECHTNIMVNGFHYLVRNIDPTATQEEERDTRGEE